MAQKTNPRRGARHTDREGCPANIFFSSNFEWVGYLKDKRLVEKSISTFAYDMLVLVDKPGSKAARLRDVVKPDKIAIGGPKDVPAGEQALNALNKAGIDKQLKNKLVAERVVRVDGSLLRCGHRSLFSSGQRIFIAGSVH